jgi:hypothetical protein
MYWIVKDNKHAYYSYTGPTWDKANLRSFCKDSYTSFKEAQELADKLTEYNQVSFHVKVAVNTKAIIFYTDSYTYKKYKDTKYKDFPAYSKIDFTLENILRLRELNSEVIVTDASILPTWAYWSEKSLKDLEPDDTGYDYLTSFTKEELNDHKRNPGNYVVLEVYNGYMGNYTFLTEEWL